MAERSSNGAMKQRSSSRRRPPQDQVGEEEKSRAEKEEKMPTVWFALKRSLHCKSAPSEVHVPKPKCGGGGGQQQQHQHQQGHLTTILTKRAVRSGCSRSIANLKDVIHGSKRHLDRPPSCSPRSIGSSEFLNPIAHEVVLSHNSKCELKITGFGGGNHEGEEVVSSFVGTLKPGTPGPAWSQGLQYSHSYRSGGGCGGFKSTSQRSPNLFVERDRVGFGGGGGSFASSMLHHRMSYDDSKASSRRSGSVSCHRCGEQFSKWETLEAHHLSKHAVTELVEGDSSRKIVEIICRTSLFKSENGCARIEKVFKIHNTQKTLARFEEYREMVKLKASKLPKKHPRCLADGNELLRFHGTTMACSLGMNGFSSLCTMEKCNVCRIIRHGFSNKKELKGGVGVFTTSTSGRAFESIETYDDDSSTRKALLVCRVIAGRVHKPLENFKELTGQTGFDSLAGRVGPYANIEELYLLNPRALLPCFVVLCKP